jgi:prepilin-type N-terminal cleavage/methylation domain-containing protein
MSGRNAFGGRRRRPCCDPNGPECWGLSFKFHFFAARGSGSWPRIVTAEKMKFERQTRAGEHGIPSRSLPGIRPAVPVRTHVWRQRRRGFTLVELLIVIAVASVVIALVGVCLSEMYRSERGIRRVLTQQAGMQRLALQFRTDAHEAKTATVTVPNNGTEADGLQLTTGDGRTIAYRADAQAVERTVRKGDQIVHRDAFDLVGTRTVWQLTLDSGQTVATVIVIHLPRPGRMADEPLYEERIEAVVGVLHGQTAETKP